MVAKSWAREGQTLHKYPQWHQLMGFRCPSSGMDTGSVSISWLACQALQWPWAPCVLCAPNSVFVRHIFLQLRDMANILTSKRAHMKPTRLPLACRKSPKVSACWRGLHCHHYSHSPCAEDRDSQACCGLLHCLWTHHQLPPSPVV